MAEMHVANVRFNVPDEQVDGIKESLRTMKPGSSAEFAGSEGTGRDIWVFVPHGSPVVIYS